MPTVVDPNLVKFKNYSAAKRRELAAKGWALPDGSFPIEDKEDLKDALHRIGTSKHARSQIVALIRKRARELGATDMLGENTAVKAASYGVNAHLGPNAAAMFATGPRQYDEQGNVVRRGKVYEAGLRLDMHGIPFEMTPAELAKIVMGFEPFDAAGRPRVPLGSGHPEAPHPLDGHLGYVSNFYLNDAGDELHAESRIPPFVDDILTAEHGDYARASMVFDRFAKEPKGLDFVDDPNVVDAALTAAFARAKHDTWSGQRDMQDIHDSACRAGAVCRKPATAANASAHEHAAFQQVHDIACSHGAKCEGKMAETTTEASTDQTAAMAAPAPSSTDTPSATDAQDQQYNFFQKMWRALFSEADRLDKTTFAAPDARANDFEANFQEDLQSGGFKADDDGDGDGHGPTTITHQHGAYGLHSHSDDNDHDDTPSADAQIEATPSNGAKAGTGGTASSNLSMAGGRTPMTSNTDVSFAELQQERARRLQLESELQREKAFRIQGEAVAFADGEIAAKRFLPASREVLIELYQQDAADDATLGPAKMASGVESSRTQRLKELFATLPEHWLTKEEMAANINHEVVAAAMSTHRARELADEGQPMTPEERAKALLSTESGRAAAKFNATSGRN